MLGSVVCVSPILWLLSHEVLVVCAPPALLCFGTAAADGSPLPSAVGRVSVRFWSEAMKVCSVIQTLRQVVIGFLGSCWICSL